MEPPAVPGAGLTAGGPEETGLDCLQFCEDIRHLFSVPNENCGGDCSSSFTALLELPPSQAVELLHSPDSTTLVPRPGFDPTPKPYSQFEAGNLTFPTNKALIERAAKFSVFAAGENANNNNNGYSSPEPTGSVPSNSSGNLGKEVKTEPAETESSQPLVSDPSPNQRAPKRKEREKKAKASSKKSKSGAANESSEDAENLPYVHVRARRGQATDSHSLAERARREKINTRMKLLQELVPGCSKISGTALVLDEIINHVQNLQRQVELLSMRLATVNPTIDFNLDRILAAESGSLMENNFPGMVMPVTWPEVQVNGNRQQYQPQWHFDGLQQPAWVREEGIHDFITPENSLLSFDSSANSASLHSNQLKMEL